jgi:hypothetical protein
LAFPIGGYFRWKGSSSGEARRRRKNYTLKATQKKKLQHMTLLPKNEAEKKRLCVYIRKAKKSSFSAVAYVLPERPVTHENFGNFSKACCECWCEATFFSALLKPSRFDGV